MVRAAVVLTGGLAVAAAMGCGRHGFAGDSDGPIGGPIDAPGDEPDGPPVVDAPPGTPDAYVIAGLVARYKMEDSPSDGVVLDDSGEGHTAVCVAGVTCPTQVAGMFGNAVHFDGAVQVLRIVDGAGALSFPDAFTIAAWIQRDVVAEQVPFARPHGPGSDDSFALVLWADRTCFESYTAGGREDACNAAVLPTGTWYHLAATWNGTSKYLYINGVRVGQLAPADPVMFDSHDIVIGMDENNGQPAYKFTGAIDEVRIYDRAISDADVMLLATP